MKKEEAKQIARENNYSELELLDIIEHEIRIYQTTWATIEKIIFDKCVPFKTRVTRNGKKMTIRINPTYRDYSK